MSLHALKEIKSLLFQLNFMSFMSFMDFLDFHVLGDVWGVISATFLY